jgi:probable F420-dependent oxidoreductase
MYLRRLGIWTAQLDYQPAHVARQAAQKIEELGFGAIWFPESTRREAFSNASLLLCATRSIVIATGIAIALARDPVTTAAAHRTLTEAYPERFLLGLGISHQITARLRGYDYPQNPAKAMREYLLAMDNAPYDAAAPVSEPKRVIAALGPKMLATAKELAWGAHTYFVTPDHTHKAREILGEGKLLAVEQAVILNDQPSVAREIARQYMKRYLSLPNYINNLIRLGFDESDFANGGSDRLVDAIVCWGGLETINSRLQEHFDAGADHVCIQALPTSPKDLPIREWEELASLLN